MAKAIGVKRLLNTSFKTLDFDGKWLESFGKPSHNFKCLIWGNSRHGKTNFTTQLIKYLSRFGKVFYNSIEEGKSRSLQIAWERNEMMDVDGLVTLLDRERVKEVIARLKKQRSIKFLVLDSTQMARLSLDDYLELVDVARNRVALIFISHAEGKEPKGAVAKELKYDADVKIYVEGFKADVASRYGGNEPYIIWQQGAEDYWGASLYSKQKKGTRKKKKDE